MATRLASLSVSTLAMRVVWIMRITDIRKDELALYSPRSFLAAACSAIHRFSAASWDA
jgi:hypothetical protein